MANEESFQSLQSLTWNKRYHQAMDTYLQIGGIKPELISALKVNFKRWSILLPQSSQDEHGRYQPVNTWGLGPEKTEIYALVDWLLFERKRDLSDSLKKRFETLYQTTRVLDEHYPALHPQSQDAQKRLVKMCRLQTDQLISFLERLVPIVFRVSQRVSSESDTTIAEVPSSPHRKRSRRALEIETIEKALIEHIQSAQDYAWATIDAGKGPMLLPRPLKKDLAKQTSMTPYSLSRCFKDSNAHQLRLLWKTCNDIKQIMRFKKK